MNTNKYRTLLFVFLVFALFLSACGTGETSIDSLDEGPKTWIEYPPEGEVFQMGSIPIVVYAANASGVSDIKITINGQEVPTGQLLSLTGGNPNLVSTEVQWQPPAEGEYTIFASSGNGAPSSLRFCVVNCGASNVKAESPASPPTSTATQLPTLAPDEPTRTPTAIPTNTNTPTPIPADTATSTPVSYAKADVEFWAAPPYLNQGDCTTLNWNITGNYQAAYIEGNPINASGSDSECPSQSYTYQLHVDEMDNSTSVYEAYVEVYEIEAPTDTPVPADSTGPSFSWANLVWESCEFYGEAGISDESGVSWAEFFYNKNGEGWNSISMNELSSEYWQSQAGVSVNDGFETPLGSIEYYFAAADSLGNESASWVSTYDYSGCGG